MRKDTEMIWRKQLNTVTKKTCDSTQKEISERTNL